MTLLTRFNASRETEPVRLCRKKAMECRRNALTATNPAVRMMYLHIAKQWNEMAEYAKRRSNGTGREREQSVVIFPNRFSKTQVKA